MTSERLKYDLTECLGFEYPVQRVRLMIERVVHRDLLFFLGEL
jgi:hypothetical protein